MSYLFTLAYLTLFTPFTIDTGFVLLRPFDLLAGMAALSVALYSRRWKPAKVQSTGVLLLLPFFAWHIVSALSLSVANGAREFLQVGEFSVFAFALTEYAPRADYEKIFQILLVGMVSIVAFTIGWHVLNGHWTDWKLLNNPKAVFGYLPSLFGCLLIFAKPDRRRLYWLVWIGLGVIILLSGERKGLIVFGLLTALISARGRWISATPYVAAGIVGLLFLATLLPDNTVGKQINALLDPTETAGTYQQITAGNGPQSLSNAQRVFALTEGSQMFAENPIFGVGTNAYIQIVANRFAWLPGYLTIGIHGEFFRVAVENGIIGLIFYCGIWLMAAIRMQRSVVMLRKTGKISLQQQRLLPFALLLSPFVYTAFDASGTPSFAVLCLVSVMPGIVEQAILRRSQPMAPPRTTVPFFRKFGGRQIEAA